MSRAVVCDRCGTMIASVMSEEGQRDATYRMHAIWLHNPFLDDNNDEYADLHLCHGCYKLFESEYLGNLVENG